MAHAAIPVRSGRRPRWLFLWLLPLLWAGLSLGAALHPGDEFAMFAAGALPAAWVFLLLSTEGSFAVLAGRVVVAGMLTYALAGLLLDTVRAPRRFWLISGLVMAGLVTFAILARQPTLQRAISKHGSLWAYVLLGAQFGLAGATLLALPAALVRYLLRRPSRPGDCRHCGYDLTGNVSGRCPECGTPLGL